MYFHKYKVFCILFFVALRLHAQEIAVDFIQKETIQNISSSVYLLQDESKEMGIRNILEPKIQEQFQIQKGQSINRPVADASYWFKFTVSNRSGEDLWLEFAEKFSGWYIDLYKPDQYGAYSNEPIESGAMRLADTNRLSKHFTFLLAAATNSKPKTYYVRIQTGMPLNVSPQIGTISAIEKSWLPNITIHIAFLGVIGAMFFYNLFIYLSIKDPIYLYYLGYLLFIFFAIPFDTGNPLTYNIWLWENFFVWHTAFYILISLFAIKYLEIPKHSKILLRMIIAGVIVLSGILPVLNFFQVVPFSSLMEIFQITLFYFYLTLFFGGYYIWRKKKVHNARFYVLGWGVLIGCVFIYIAAFNGLVVMNDLTQDIMYFGFSGEATLFALALGDRLNTLKKEKDAMYLRNLELVKDQNRELERIVQEKTEELEGLFTETNNLIVQISQTNGELSKTKDDLEKKQKELEEIILQLRSTQDQLVQSEKMASVGVLAAGVAHEINNPLNFIIGGTNVIRNFVGNNSSKKSPEVVKALDGIEEGVDRASKIVESLSSYSRQQIDKSEPCDLHLIIDGALTVVDRQIRSEITVEKKYTSSNFITSGNAAELRQALVNILENSIQSISGKGTIIITTESKMGELWITIQDNGSGIPTKFLNSVFDPFFTTKDPGKGTGLGLSFTQKIIKEHGGKIYVDSEEKKGTALVIILNPAKWGSD